MSQFKRILMFIGIGTLWYASAENPEIHEIPTKEIQFNDLQIKTLNPKSQMLNYKGYIQGKSQPFPIEDCCLTPDYVFISIPSKNLVVRLSRQLKPTLIIGPQKDGGNTVPLNQPGPMGFFDPGLVVGSIQDRSFIILNQEGDILNYDQPDTHFFTIPGPRQSPKERRYLTLTHHDASLLTRINQRGKPIFRYHLGPTIHSRNNDGLDWTFRCRPQILDDWSVVLTYFGSGQMDHIAKDGMIQQRIRLRGFKGVTPIPNPHFYDVRPQERDLLMDASFDGQDYWLLVAIHSTTRLILKGHGSSYQAFQLPGAWDGLRVDAGEVLVFNRIQGIVQSFSKP